MGERTSLRLSPGTILLLRAPSFPLSSSAGSAWARRGSGGGPEASDNIDALAPYLAPARQVVDTRPRDRWTDGRWGTSADA
jgi:hypothetical protein